MRIKTLPFLLFCGFVMSLSSATTQQYIPKKNRSDHFGKRKSYDPLYTWVYDIYEKFGIHFALGANYTMTPIKPFDSHSMLNSSSTSVSDTTIEARINSKGRPGIYGEIGMVHISRKPNKYVHYYDWGVGVKYLGGAEITDAEMYRKGMLLKKVFGQGEFYRGYIHFRFSAHNIARVSNRLFIDNALGVNADFATLYQQSHYEGFHMKEREKFQGIATVQLHYSIGLGFKPYPKKGYYFVPNIQLPVLGLYGSENLSPRMDWFSSKYYPITINAKFVWLLKKMGKRCPPVYNNSMDRELIKQSQNQ